MEVTMKMTGAKELEEFMLKHLPATVARRTLLAGMRKSAKPIESYAKSIVARRSGALQQSIGMITMRQGKEPATPNGKPAVAALRMGPLSGQGARALSAWAIYQSYYRGGKISLKKGSPIGQIRHGHLVEFGFTMRDGRKYPARPFMSPAVAVGGPSYVNSLVRVTREKVKAAIAKHNARSPARRR